MTGKRAREGRGVVFAWRVGLESLGSFSGEDTLGTRSRLMETDSSSLPGICLKVGFWEKLSQ